MKFIVFGLGNFGSALSEQLVRFGHEVIGVDERMEKVDRFKNTVTHTIALDSTNREAVAQLPVRDVDAVVIAIGENEGANIMTTALLKQMGARRIISRITSHLQKVVLEAMDIREFSNPEVYSAERLAFKLDMPGILDSFPITGGYRILEVTVPKRYEGQQVKDLLLGSKFRLVLVSILKKTVHNNIFGTPSSDLRVMGVIAEDAVLEKGDVMLLFGTPKDLERFVEG